MSEQNPGSTLHLDQKPGNATVFCSEFLWPLYLYSVVSKLIFCGNCMFVLKYLLQSNMSVHMIAN